MATETTIPPFAPDGMCPKHSLYPRKCVLCEVERQRTETTVGTIWRTSWGYDQTNVEYFEVVRETAHSVVVRAIKATVQNGRVYPLAGQWTTDFGLMGNPGTPERMRDEARGYSEKMCRKPGIGRDGYHFQGITIDDVRHAYPYEGGGAYDTIAAGGMGH